MRRGSSGLSVAKAFNHVNAKRAAYIARSLHWYDFSEGDGETLTDKGSLTKNLAITGAAWAADGAGYHLTFLGDDKAEISDAWPTSGITKLSFVMKFSCKPHTDPQWIVNGEQIVANGTITIIRDTGASANVLRFRYSNGTTSTAHVSSVTFFSGFDDVDVFCVVTADYVSPYNVKIYRDVEGVIVSENMITPVAPSGTRKLSLGVYSNNYYIQEGRMRFFAVFPEILTESEVRDLFFLL